MTTIQGLYFSDYKLTAKEVLTELKKRNLIRKIDIINIIKEW